MRRDTDLVISKQSRHNPAVEDFLRFILKGFKLRYAFEEGRRGPASRWKKVEHTLSTERIFCAIMARIGEYVSDMDKEEALNAFYEKNGINPARASDEDDDSYDPRLAELPNQVDQWLSGIQENDREMFLTLLSRYTYLRQAECRGRYHDILVMLGERLAAAGLGLNEALFVTVEAGGACASGGDNVRADILSRNLRYLTKKQVVAILSRMEAQDLKPYRAVVFVDDIVGTGFSLWKAIRTFHERFQAADQKLFFACIAPREKGISHIQKNCKKNGIDIEPLFKQEWILKEAVERDTAAYSRLEPYERQVGEYLTEEGITFFMGFRQSKLSVSFYYNTPNNTLCTFWRLGKDMRPLFYRNADQPFRPSIEELKAEKQRKCDQAYCFGQDRRKKEDGQWDGFAVDRPSDSGLDLSVWDDP